MMMKTMAKTQSMKIRAFKAPFRENFLQILDMTPPKPRFGEGPDDLVPQITMETCPRETGIRGKGIPSSYICFICVTDNGVPQICSQSQE